MNSTSSRRIRIFDTTLRDGEQSPGCSMNLAEKESVFSELVQLNVDVVEAGFPVTSPEDFAAVKRIAEIARGSKITICGLARCADKDIESAAAALENAEKSRIHVFLATSAIHREFKLAMSKDQIIERSIKGIEKALRYTDEVEFSPEDAARTEDEFLCQIVTEAINAGATVINIPDTVGYSVPSEIYAKITKLRKNVHNIDRAQLSIHCHNDLGNAVANSLAAVQAGVDQVECTINGIGERAGNAALEEVVMNLHVRPDIYNAHTTVNTERLVPASRALTAVTGVSVQQNKAVVGKNAFAHEAGIHQDGMLKERTTYEIMTPESVGAENTDLVLGKHSGRAAINDRLKTYGISVTAEQLVVIYDQFKDLADKKKEVYDGDIIALAQAVLRGREVTEMPRLTLDYYKYVSASNEQPRVEFSLVGNGTDAVRHSIEDSDGIIDAFFKTICATTGLQMELEDFSTQGVTKRSDAQGRAFVSARVNGKLIKGVGISTDTNKAAFLAIVDIVNSAKNMQFTKQKNDQAE